MYSFASPDWRSDAVVNHHIMQIQSLFHKGQCLLMRCTSADFILDSIGYDPNDDTAGSEGCCTSVGGHVKVKSMDHHIYGCHRKAGT